MDNQSSSRSVFVAQTYCIDVDQLGKRNRRRMIDNLYCKHLVDAHDVSTCHAPLKTPPFIYKAISHTKLTIIRITIYQFSS